MIHLKPLPSTIREKSTDIFSIPSHIDLTLDWQGDIEEEILLQGSPLSLTFREPLQAFLPNFLNNHFSLRYPVYFYQPWQEVRLIRNSFPGH